MARVDTAQAINLRLNHNLSTPQIAKIQGVSKQAVHKRLQAFLPNDSTELYKTNRADILATAQLKILTQIDQPKLKKAGLRDLVVSAGILYDKERLERGLSSQNVSYNVITDQLKKIDEEEADLRRQLIELGAEDPTVGGQDSNTIVEDSNTE